METQQILNVHSPTCDKFFSEYESASLCSKVTSTRRRRRRHIPHSQRPTEFVRNRNSRERKRVDDLNSAFESLKDSVPLIPKRSVRTSKMKILTNAISYIHQLSDMIRECGEFPASSVQSGEYGPSEHTVIKPADFCCKSETQLFEDRIPAIMDQSQPEDISGRSSTGNAIMSFTDELIGMPSTLWLGHQSVETSNQWSSSEEFFIDRPQLHLKNQHGSYADETTMPVLSSEYPRLGFQPLGGDNNPQHQRKQNATNGRYFGFQNPVLAALSLMAEGNDFASDQFLTTHPSCGIYAS